MKLSDINEVIDHQKYWTLSSKGSIRVNKDALSMEHRSLEQLNLPERVDRDFNCSELSPPLLSLKGCPRYVKATFNCVNNNLSSLQYAPEFVGTQFLCGANKITNLHNIHKIVKHALYFNAWGNPIEHSILGICLIDGLANIHVETVYDVGTVHHGQIDRVIEHVFNQTKDKSQRLIMLQDMLIDMGLEPLARL